MDMNTKKMFLIVALLLMATMSFFLGHFWSYAISVLQRAVVVGIAPFLVSSKFLAGITTIRFLA
jgi:hypothetical protein